ncbi:hypothetical protein FHS16_003590 [Paenibacillus endophyticus]|uniref:Uncharacterized protein n=1 Tax=Paenibacillus endophyticus TaxID=1294268 RepID=A0A7W5C9B6_9BACL|nr:hypothetical protein [Paenibacillus endophyticus]MBB3153528.1 hypothetical protein [Paenibacillus endophyticus]
MQEKVPNNKPSSTTIAAPISGGHSAPASPIMNPSHMTQGQILQLQRTAGNRALQGIVIQRAGGGASSGTPTPPAQTPEQLRRAELAAYRDAQSPGIAQAALDDTRQKVKGQLGLFLSKDSQAASIRTSLDAKATEAVKSNMDATSSVSDQARTDAKKYAKDYAKAGVDQSLLKYAGDLTDTELPDSKKADFEAVTKQGFDTVAPKTSKALDEQKTNALAAANKKAKELTSSLLSASVTKSKRTVSNKVKSAGSNFLDATIDVGDAGKSAVTDRSTMDTNGTLSAGLNTDEIYQNALANPLKTAVLSKLGVGRGEFRRSKELNTFRQELKDAAREKANADIDVAVTSSTPLAKEYKSMMAKTKAFKLAKGSVDNVMADKAVEIIEATVPKDTTKVKLGEAGKSAAYDIVKGNSSTTEKIKAASIAGAMREANKLLLENQPKAVLKARDLVKKTPPAQNPQMSGLKDDVKTKVTSDGIATKAIQSVEADNLNSGFAKLGKIVDLAAPSAGDSASLAVELKIPVPSAPGLYFLFAFGGEAERDEDEISCNTQLTFGAGFQTFGLDANFRLGVYLDASGKTTTSVMNLMSYGLYRQMRSSPIVPKSAPDFFYGQGGRSGSSKLEEAEKWAMMIEEQDMTGDNSVDIGVLVQLGMEANAGVAEFSAELAYKYLSRYNKKLVDAKSQGHTSLEDRAKRIGKGEIRHIVEGATEVAVTLGSTKVAFGLEGAMTFSSGRLRELNIGLSANVPAQFGEETSQFAEIAGKIVTASVGSLKNLVALIQAKYKSSHGGPPMDGTRAAGSVVDSGSDALFMGSHFDSIGASLSEKITGDETVNDTIRSWLPGQDSSASDIEQVGKIGLSNSLQLAIEFEKSWDAAGTAGDWEIALSASQVKSLSIDAGIAVVEVEKSKRLGKIGFNQDGLTGGIAGLEK